MTEEEYLAQDKYFSESMQEFIEIKSMAFPYAFNAMKKLNDDMPYSFKDSTLYNAFMAYLIPSTKEIGRMLLEHGSVAHVHWGNTTTVRSRLYNAAKTVSVKVTTHKTQHWVTATVVDV